MELVGKVTDICGLYLVMENYAAHKHKNVKAWLEQNPRFTVHFTPTHASWMNLAEVWFGIVERQAIRRDVFTSVKDLNFKSAPLERAPPHLMPTAAKFITSQMNR